jgi:chorismate mutase
MIALRGATTIKENSVGYIKEASLELFEELIKANSIALEDIVSIIFSCTEDVNKDYPGKFVREHYKLSNTAIMHFNEMKVENSLPLCIRIMLLINKASAENIKFVYLNNAKTLRRDLVSDNLK